MLNRVKWHDAKLLRMMWENLIDYLDFLMAAFSSIGKIPMKDKLLRLFYKCWCPHTKHLRQQKSQVVLSTSIVSQACGSVCCEMLFTHTPSPSPNQLCPVLVSLVFLHMFLCLCMVLRKTTQDGSTFDLILQKNLAMFF